jgi:hypothetical protein
MLQSSWESALWPDALPPKHSNSWPNTAVAQYQEHDDDGTSDSIEKDEDLLRDLSMRRSIAHILPQTYSQICCSNGASEVASLFMKQGEKGINQDAMVVIEV